MLLNGEIARGFCCFGLGFLLSMFLFGHMHGEWWTLSPFLVIVLACLIGVVEQQYKRHPDRGLIAAIIDGFLGERRL